MKHQFSLFIKDLSEKIKNLKNSDQFCFEDESCARRLQQILRVQTGDQVIFFDQNMHIVFELVNIERKKEIIGIIEEKNENKTLKPCIIFLLPLLKREALESAVYSLCEIGANEIQLVTTHKIQRKWSEKEQNRLNRIIISAAEQSKNYAFPVLKGPQLLDECIKKIGREKKFFFDSCGVPVLEAVKIAKGSDSLTLLIGPEGDLTQDEKKFLENYDFIFTRLTSTILRASQAAAVSLGIFRSLL